MTRTSDLGLRGLRRAALAAALVGTAALLLAGPPDDADAGPPPPPPPADRPEAPSPRPAPKPRPTPSPRPATPPPPRGAALPAGSFVVVAAGDISGRCGRAKGLACPAERTARRVEAARPTFVLALGDNQYDLGTVTSYRRFYETTWGRFKSRTRPVPGNHETYDPNGSSVGYRAYFGSLAAPHGTTYYSFDHGGWHFVALDSNIGMSATSKQYAWLTKDLASNTRACTLAYWHHPLFSSGEHGNTPASRPIWRLLLRANSEIVLNGHDHQYERFAPRQVPGANAAHGIREFVVGTGGADRRSFTGRQAQSAVRIGGIYAVLKLTLNHGSYSWQLIEDTGRIRDQGSGPCH